jgi:hypothetical protein
MGRRDDERREIEEQVKKWNKSSRTEDDAEKIGVRWKLWTKYPADDDED